MKKKIKIKFSIKGKWVKSIITVFYDAIKLSNSLDF